MHKMAELIARGEGGEPRSRVMFMDEDGETFEL